MVYEETRADASWWGIVKSRAAACWWRLLLLALVPVVAEWALRFIGSAVEAPLAITLVLPILVGAAVSALVWAPKLELLSGRRGLLGRAGAGVALLAVALLVPRARHLVIMTSFLFPESTRNSAASALLLPPGGMVLDLAALLGAIALTLLPTAVLMEGAGVRRAWAVLRGDWRTVLRVIAITLIPAVVSSFVLSMAMSSFYSGFSYLYMITMQLTQPLVNVLMDAVTAVLLYATWQCAVAVRNANGARQTSM
ncbi:hypothetical protein ACFYS8_04230 [Kitasatospora sp. NPDC004615]|uniref:hypothetical protein n=1 Tax=Kitasatospora sp. NPDC004615 TaxID=3364017 RepID=UPI00368600AF